MSKIFAVTTPQLTANGQMSYSFMLAPGVSDDILECGYWGVVTIRHKGENEVNPFRLARGEPNAVGDDGVMRWDLHLFAPSEGNVYSGGADAHPPQEDGLRELLTGGMHDKGSVALLMERNVFDRVQSVCTGLGIEVQVHHHPEPLSTS